ncbi:MAG: Ig-like domain-containing protein, partial [Burkholderiales bacterium]|nr:Ig-like domain-containing protein [Burkholderiales bacterium]
MKYLRKLVNILVLPILLIILTNCNSNAGSNANTGTTNSAVATASVSELTVTESYAYGSIDNTHNTSIKGVLSVVLMFNTPLDQSTVTTSNIYIQDSSGNKVTSNNLLLSDNSQTVVLTPAQALSASGSYTVVVTTAVKSTMGLTLKSNANFPFTMSTSASDVKLPTVALLNPYGNSTNIQITFSEPMNGKYINSTYIKLYSGTSTSGTPLHISIWGPTSGISPSCTSDYRICPIIITNSSTGATIIPKGTYTLSITTKLGSTYTITDLAGNHLVETTTKDGNQYRNFTFTVADPAKATTVTMTDPTSKQTNVAPSTSVTLQFSNVVYGV